MSVVVCRCLRQVSRFSSFLATCLANCSTLSAAMFLVMILSTDVIASDSPNRTDRAKSLTSAKPYWKSKPHLLTRMRDERYITVSVQRQNVRAGVVGFSMAGAGDIAREKDDCFRIAQDYDKLKQISDHFKTVTFDEKNQKLFVITEALGYQARMMMQLKPVENERVSEIHWEVIWGSFKGMKGVIGFERLGRRSTEISFTGEFEAAELPIPKILMGFVLEGIMQKVAEKMRTYLESHIA